MRLKLVEILFSRRIVLFSLPPSQSLFTFALVCLGGRAQGRLCICPVRIVSCASFLVGGH
jgi:hypothetical protein